MNDSLLRSQMLESVMSFNGLTFNKLSNSDGSKPIITGDLIDHKDTTCLSNNQIFMQENLEKSDSMTIFQYLKSKVANKPTEIETISIFDYILEKGGKGYPIGTIRRHADGTDRIKTAKGWRPVPKTKSSKSAGLDADGKELRAGD